ncbi:hypothetical protein [uncultured Enterovirga sp.]|uniref:hypothetical protein n=1 Tax=uncultured Enterovirga sp. TaxID=2026352 RepID=UPI0035CAE2FE
MTEPIPAYGFKPETDRSYLVFCPEHGGWHVGEWWTVDGPGRWVLACDAGVDLTVSHVLELPADPITVSVTIAWSLARQVTAAGRA